MKVFEKILKRKYPGKKLLFFKRGSTIGGVIPPQHFGGVVVQNQPVGSDTVIADKGDNFIIAVKPHSYVEGYGTGVQQLDLLSL